MSYMGNTLLFAYREELRTKGLHLTGLFYCDSKPI
jgi:hypothetical protein